MSFFEKIAEFVSMIQVALSPILVFSIISAVAYFGLDAPWNLFLAISSGIVGLIAGTWLAIYVHRKKGALEFMSRIDASPELDKKEEEPKK